MKTEGAPLPLAETEIVQPQPFSIRGHHLNLYSIINRGVDPALFAMRMKVGYQWELLGLDTEKVALAQDTIGTTSATAGRYEQSIRDTFEQFLQLPGDYPVEIHSQPDAICSTCVFGEHCDTKNQVIGDSTYTGFFIDFAKKRGLDEKIIVTSEIVWIEKKTLGLSTYRVRTDAETVRNVLTGGNFERMGTEKI